MKNNEMTILKYALVLKKDRGDLICSTQINKLEFYDGAKRRAENESE